MAKAAADAGMAALSGEAGPTFDALMYSAGIYLWHLQKFASIKEACDAVREVLASGNAAKRVK
jgi:anthranilate phosphoribosyltransferase